jgi:hypothetical protein
VVGGGGVGGGGGGLCQAITHLNPAAHLASAER